MLEKTSLLYKLTILYLLSRIDYPISNNSLSNFLLENDFTDYFNLQQIMGELIDDGYVDKRVIRNKTLYRISESGLATFKLLSRELSPSMKADVDKYLLANNMNLIDDISVMSNYYRADLNNYISNMYIEENGSKILELNVSTTNEEDAARICANWVKSSERLYPMIISELMKRN